MLITVFTPTYNRVHTINRTFESLCNQSTRNFEWLIIDDGSTDNTEEKVKEFITLADFPIKYIKKENGGKHTAYNMAVKEANGKLFFTVDSDDWLPDDSLNFIESNVDILFKNENLAGIIALKAFSDNNIIGVSYPENRFICSLEDLEKNHLNGERTIILKTDIAKAFPFPIILGEKYMGESVIYNEIGKRYKFEIFNKILTVCEYQQDGLTQNIAKLLVKNPIGYMLYESQRIDLSVGLRKRILSCLRYHGFRRLSNREVSNEYKYLGNHNALVLLTSPLGRIIAKYYILKSKK